MAITDIRQWCRELFTTKNIRVACSDWTALQIEFEKALETGKIAPAEKEDDLEEA